MATVSNDIRWLRAAAIAWSLRSYASLADAVETLGFVQYDPIRAPTRAQDLILSQRVKRYRAGDLDRAYETLNIDEGHLHVYGAMRRDVLSLLHSRTIGRGLPLTEGISELEAAVLAEVRERGRVDAQMARGLFERAQVVNAWGGMSSATTEALEHLQYRGLLRIAARRNGSKVYEAVEQPPANLSPEERMQGVTMLQAHLLAPIPVQTLRSTLSQSRLHGLSGAPSRASVITGLRDSGELDGREIDGVSYVWPAELNALPVPEPEARVRFLAPFDPVVWDRRRFEHLWGWEYRFEAYTPVPKRRLGYYALPLLWRDDVIGWVNCLQEGAGAMRVEPGFVRNKPSTKLFQRAFEAEVERLSAMTGLRVTTES